MRAFLTSATLGTALALAGAAAPAVAQATASVASGTWARGLPPWRLLRRPPRFFATWVYGGGVQGPGHRWRRTP